MPKRTRYTVCTVNGCPEYSDRGGRCDAHRAAADRARGTAQQRGYGKEHRTRFRPGVLARDPSCVCTETSHGHPEPCGQASVHADHHPLSRRELVDAGHDADDPRHGRGLCHSCHAKATAQHQPGGWNA